MKIIDLFKAHSFEEILPSLDHLFEVNCGHNLIQEDCLKWEALYYRWANCSNPKATDSHVYLTTRWECTLPMLDMNCTVCNGANEILYPLAKHKCKEEVLGMEVVVEDNLVIDEFDLTAGLFWEMTYYPYDD